MFQMADSKECEEARWGVGRQDWYSIRLQYHFIVQERADEDFKRISDIIGGQEEYRLKNNNKKQTLQL